MVNRGPEYWIALHMSCDDFNPMVRTSDWKEGLVLKKKFMDVHTSIVKSWLNKQLFERKSFVSKETELKVELIDS